MVKIEVKSKRSNLQDTQVRAMCSQLASSYCNTLESFERCFKEDILKIKRNNNFQHSFFYKLYKEAERLELWKLGLHGEKRYIIMVIEEVPGDLHAFFN